MSLMGLAFFLTLTAAHAPPTRNGAFSADLIRLQALTAKASDSKRAEDWHQVIKEATAIEIRYPKEKGLFKVINMRAVALSVVGRKPEATAAEDIILNRYPNSPAADVVYHMRAWDLFDARDFKRAAVALERALRRDSSDPRTSATSHLYLGWSLRELGRGTEAKPHFRKVIELAKTNKNPYVEKLATDAQSTLDLDK